MPNFYFVYGDYRLTKLCHNLTLQYPYSAVLYPYWVLNTNGFLPSCHLVLCEGVVQVQHGSGSPELDWLVYSVRHFLGTSLVYSVLLFWMMYIYKGRFTDGSFHCYSKLVKYLCKSQIYVISSSKLNCCFG